ncbi:E3 ubiquitin protein ligase DRIP2 [Daucus carota subsp. sativus]
MKMAISNNNNDREKVLIRKAFMAKLLTCSICNNIFKDPVNISECLHIFCNRCIREKIEEENLNRCPVCSLYLGSMPLDKLRPDHSWSAITASIGPSLGQAVKVDDEISSGEAEQSSPSPARRKKRRLSSLLNKGSASSPYTFERRKKENGRRIFSSQGSDSPLDNPQKSTDGRSQGSRSDKNLRKSDSFNKQFSAVESSKQQIRRKSRDRTQKNDKRMELVSNLLKPPTELENIRNYAKSVKKGEISCKTTSISKCEATSSGKDLRSCDVPTRPIRKTRYQTKQADEQQGSKFPTPAVEDTATTQHTKRVAPVWLSLVSAVNQEGVRALPQIPCRFLMIKDATVPISSIKKYLSQKLGLDSKEEVEITMRGSALPSSLELHAVVDLWSQTMSSSEKFSAKVGESAENFVMVLCYGRKYLCRRNRRISMPGRYDDNI